MATALRLGAIATLTVLGLLTCSWCALIVVLVIVVLILMAVRVTLTLVVPTVLLVWVAGIGIVVATVLSEQNVYQSTNCCTYDSS